MLPTLHCPSPGQGWCTQQGEGVVAGVHLWGYFDTSFASYSGSCWCASRLECVALWDSGWERCLALLSGLPGLLMSGDYC